MPSRVYSVSSDLHRLWGRRGGQSILDKVVIELSHIEPSTNLLSFLMMPNVMSSDSASRILLVKVQAMDLPDYCIRCKLELVEARIHFSSNLTLGKEGCTLSRVEVLESCILSISPVTLFQHLHPPLHPVVVQVERREFSQE